MTLIMEAEMDTHNIFTDPHGADQAVEKALWSMGITRVSRGKEKKTEKWQPVL